MRCLKADGGMMKLDAWVYLYAIIYLRLVGVPSNTGYRSNCHNSPQPTSMSFLSIKHLNKTHKCILLRRFVNIFEIEKYILKLRVYIIFS